MPCKLCTQQGQMPHSFQKLGTLKDGKTSIYYTSPRRCSYATEGVKRESIENTEYYQEHFKDTLPDPWIWVFDAKDMKNSQYISTSGARKMIQIIETEYSKTLKCVYIVNPTTAMRVFLGVMRPFLSKEANERVYMCSLGPIEVIDKLQGLRIGQAELLKVLKLME